MPESATAGDWALCTCLPCRARHRQAENCSPLTCLRQAKRGRQATPSIRLPAIDRLEGFSPEGRCFYRRVLFPVSIILGSFTVAWVYVGEEALNTQTHWQLKEIKEWNPERK